MGLFDNLFLDANTPVTINDGIDHSKDVVQPLPETQPASGGWSGATWWVQDPKDDTQDPKKDGALTDLFGANAAEEKAADAILSPEPPADIALEIWLGPTPAGSSTPVDTPVSVDAAASFDIGGDISFDIGGDMTMSSDAVSAGVSIGWDVSAWANGEMLPEVIKTSESSFISHESEEQSPTANGESVTTATSTNISAPEVAEIDVVPTNNLSEVQAAPENALFSLLNEDSATAVGDSAENQTEDSTTSTEISAPVVSDSLFDMMKSDDVIEAVAIDSSEKPSDTPSISFMPSHNVASSETLAHSDIIASSAPKLRQKLSEFLSELETMEVWDETTKAHKMDQIRMCETRIAEIESESYARISALQHEIAALKTEIEDMDKEKTHIKNVIETFQKELETA